MRSQPVFVQIQAKPWPLRYWKYAVANRRFRALRHLLLVAAEGAQSIFHLENARSLSFSVRREAAHVFCENFEGQDAVSPCKSLPGETEVKATPSCKSGAIVSAGRIIPRVLASSR